MQTKKTASRWSSTRQTLSNYPKAALVDIILDYEGQLDESDDIIKQLRFTRLASSVVLDWLDKDNKRLKNYISSTVCVN